MVSDNLAIGRLVPDAVHRIVPDIPIQSIAINKFMSECRALTNLFGNGVACVVISRSEGELDKDKLHETMAHPIELGEALKPGR